MSRLREHDISGPSIGLNGQLQGCYQAALDSTLVWLTAWGLPDITMVSGWNPPGGPRRWPW
jgi:hypothetical protein